MNKLSSYIVIISASLCVIWPIGPAISQLSDRNLTKGMRFCGDRESPIILVDNKRVQICRRMTMEDYVAFGKLLQSVTPPPPSKELAQNGKLCEALYLRNDRPKALPYCERASQLGLSSASFLVAKMADDEGSKDKALEYYAISSDQGQEEGALFAGVRYAAKQDRLNAAKHLYRCYQKSINGDQYNGKPYAPTSKYSQTCTDSVIKLILDDRIDPGPFYNQVAIVPADIASEIPFTDYEKYQMGFRVFNGQWDSYKSVKLSQFKYSGYVNYKIWMVRDIPVICQFKNREGKFVDVKTEESLCRYFQVNFKYRPALSGDGNEISSILEGGMMVSIPRTR